MDTKTYIDAYNFAKTVVSGDKEYVKPIQNLAREFLKLASIKPKNIIVVHPNIDPTEIRKLEDAGYLIISSINPIHLLWTQG